MRTATKLVKKKKRKRGEGRLYSISKHKILVIRQKCESNRIDNTETERYIYENLVYDKSVFSNIL